MIPTVTRTVLNVIDVDGTGSTSSDSEVLLLLKQRTTCDEEFWANRNGWNANVTDLNSWSGVTATANGRVTKLDLSTDFDYFVNPSVPTLSGEE